MKYRIRGWLLMSGLILLTGCQDQGNSDAPVAADVLLERPVATVYQVMADAGSVSCFRMPSAASETLTSLQNGQFVDLVSLDEGLAQSEGEFWVHVYPRLSHRPSCYINTRYLIPQR